VGGPLDQTVKWYAHNEGRPRTRSTRTIIGRAVARGDTAGRDYGLRGAAADLRGSVLQGAMEWSPGSAISSSERLAPAPSFVTSVT
jgi:hypothetical protein